MLIVEGGRPRRGKAWEARFQAQLDEHKYCLKCGFLGVPTHACPSGVHCYCQRCRPQPCGCRQ